MILSFDRQFPTRIMNGIKIHTIREDQHNRWKAGMKIQMAIGARTKSYEQFDERICTGVQIITIAYIDDRGAVKVEVDGKQLGVWHRFLPQESVNPEAIELLARNDGFQKVDDFLKWFQRDFEGKIIHWTDFKYD